MALSNSRATRELAGLGACFASVDISNSHITHSEARRESQIPDKPEGSLILPLQIWKGVNSEGAMPDATASPNLHSQILDSPQYITISDVGQHSTSMRYYFYYQCNGFIGYFHDPVPECAVIYAGSILFW